ncbi:MAG: hypothetical protein IKA79_05960 [Lentisphaeria bacterium]|nr:hypothetical protein [Lentisphaeria bacterium]
MKHTPLAEKLFLFLVSAVLLISGGCFPVLDLEPRETSDLSVVQLITRMNRTTYPLKKWRKADSYYMRLKVTLTGKDSKDYYGSEVWYQQPKCFRLVTSKNGKVQKILIYNDGRAWSINGWNNRSTELKEDSLEYKLFLNTVRMGTPSLNYTDIFRRISVDMFVENGVRYYRMICMNDDRRIQPYIFYFNGKNFLQEKLETVSILNESGASELYTSYVEKYTVIDGIKLPARTIVEIGGTTQISELQELVINQNYPESLFLPPVPFTHKMNTGMEKETNSRKESR